MVPCQVQDAILASPQQEGNCLFLAASLLKVILSCTVPALKMGRLDSIFFTCFKFYFSRRVDDNIVVGENDHSTDIDNRDLYH